MVPLQPRFKYSFLKSILHFLSFTASCVDLRGKILQKSNKTEQNAVEYWEWRFVQRNRTLLLLACIPSITSPEPALYNDNTLVWFSSDVLHSAAILRHLHGDTMWSKESLPKREAIPSDPPLLPIGDRYGSDYFSTLRTKGSAISRCPRTKLILIPLPPSLYGCVCVSSKLLSLSPGNLRCVSSRTTPSSVGLRSVKQRHLITAEATLSSVDEEQKAQHSL